jgi:hypothetical protein
MAYLLKKTKKLFKQCRKTFVKFKAMQKQAEALPAVKIFGKKSKICVIAWGSLFCQ